MLKKRFQFKNNFKKLKKKKKYFLTDNVNIWLKNKNKLNKKIIVILLKKIKKLLKKKKFKFFININTNLIKSYKSKNARMGNGKGQLNKKIIKHDSFIFFKLFTSKTKNFFFKKFISFFL